MSENNSLYEFSPLGELSEIAALEIKKNRRHRKGFAMYR